MIDISASCASARSQFRCPLKRPGCLLYSRSGRYASRVRVYTPTQKKVSPHHLAINKTHAPLHHPLFLSQTPTPCNPTMTGTVVIVLRGTENDVFVPGGVKSAATKRGWKYRCPSVPAVATETGGTTHTVSGTAGWCNALWRGSRACERRRGDIDCGCERE